MASLLLRTEILAIRCVGNTVLVGMGPTLYVFRDCKFECKLDCLYPSNIHGIVVGTDNILAVFGAKSICICKLVEIGHNIRIRKQSIDQFNDWIIAAKWISFKKEIRLAVLFAHNYISTYDILNKTCQIIRCEETCILYGGSISGTSQENLVIFSGTVFQEILIWKVDNRCNDTNKRMPVLHRLTGHKGVIFSVICDPSLRLICSTSDDRSVRFWKITEDENSKSNNINWQTVKIEPIKTMFMHTARVWKALIRNDIVLTIGEDSLICTWSLSGNLLNKAYYKAPIWSIDVSEDNIVYVGGGDGSVHMQPFEHYKSLETIFLSSGNDTCNFPKYVSYLHDGTILVFTELGTLLHYNKEMMLKNTIYLTKEHYYIMQVSPNRNFVALASRDGYAIVYEEYLETLQQFTEKNKIMDSQILSLQWLNNSDLIACGANGLLKLLSGNLTVCAECILPPSRERWLTAAIIYKDVNPPVNYGTSYNLLICGDRAGNIYVFDLKYVHFDTVINTDISRKPIQTLDRIHGKIGVQSFYIFGENLITSGRDGMLRFYQIHLTKDSFTYTKPLVMLHKKKMPMDWISGMLKVNVKRIGGMGKNEIFFVFGFKQVEFVIYNLLNENVIVRIPCGGGHRSWDCIISHTKASFAYIKNKQVHVCNMASSLFLSHPVLQNGFHIKETCCLRYISIKQSDHYRENIFISGSEDCTLRISSIFEYDFQWNVFKNLGTFNGHLSGIRCLSVVELNMLHESEFQYLVFSGGGRAQLKIWKLNFNFQSVDPKNPHSIKKLNMSCFDVNSHMLYKQNQYCKKPWQETKQSCIEEPETRYMDIYAYYPKLNYVLVFIACADGYLRLLVYDIVTNNTYLKVSTKYINRCILKIHILLYKSKVIVLTMSTDGKLRFFDFTDMVSKIHEDANSGNQNILNFDDIPFAEFSLHQSGINCFDLKDMNENKYLLVTGGDDNLLNVTYFQIYLSENKLSAEILSKWNTASAHSTQIVGVKLKDNTICSVGIDQQVIIYNYSCSNGVIHVDILNQVFTSVTDVQGMELYSCPNHDKSWNDFICIYGRGFEIMSI
ncbi:WD repeat-containing protein 6 [Trachymyrmex septentrionalis]|uniref:tRNA (34-2'-O)-methyltransferase regulator WDR6 n=1 Tax=Trachymyrmex septentrionalis TaxID=34720 RepID=A0A151JSQ9_9HYME|nr:PREDICTED: WD repeat-containing protein 6 [Trachymyrmex septentrionalis]KYN30635.1 WD repeat-containing protein 6 [Trachymyrmex septentrionalis]